MADWNILGWVSYDSDYPNVNFEDVDQNTITQKVLENISQNGYRFSGNDHQNHPNGAPLFEGGYVLRCSMRTWGLFMAVANDGNNDYMNYYMDCDDPVYPEDKDVKIQKGKENDALPVLIGPDQQLVLQSVQLGFELMTTDKAILTLYPLFKMKFGV